MFESAIRVDSISKEYRSGRGRVRALDEVSFTVGTGETIAVVGKSGSGKTTLLHCVAGLERPESGRVTCFGVDVHSLSARNLCLFQRKNLGFVFQYSSLISYLTVYENIGFPLILNRMERKNREQRIAGLLDRIGLSGAGAALPHELSGGEMQRVAVARAIAHSPRLVVADEPTASLDSATGWDLVKLMFDMGREQGCTMIVSTHDPELLGLAHSSIGLRDGRIEETA